MEAANRISTTEELEAIRAAALGLIVNVDLPMRTTTFHRPDCRTLTNEAYEQKNVVGGGRTGAWYFQLHRDDDAGHACSVCLGA